VLNLCYINLHRIKMSDTILEEHEKEIQDDKQERICLNESERKLLYSTIYMNQSICPDLVEKISNYYGIETENTCKK